MKFSKKNGKSNIIIAMEPTGHYWENLADELKNQGILVVLVSTLAYTAVKKWTIILLPRQTPKMPV